MQRRHNQHRLDSSMCAVHGGSTAPAAVQRKINFATFTLPPAACWPIASTAADPGLQLSKRKAKTFGQNVVSGGYTMPQIQQSTRFSIHQEL